MEFSKIDFNMNQTCLVINDEIMRFRKPMKNNFNSKIIHRNGIDIHSTKHIFKLKNSITHI